MDSEPISARRLLYVCATPPSNVSGAASILQNLFEGYPNDRLHLLVEDANLASVRARGVGVPWSSETVHIPDWSRARSLVRRGLSRQSDRRPSGIGGSGDRPQEGASVPSNRLQRWAWHIDKFTEIVWAPVVALRAVRMIRSRRLDAIFTVQGGPTFVVGAYLASLLCRVPIFVFSMDAWAENSRYQSRLHEWVASTFEPRVLRRSSARWAISHFQARDWQARYGVTADVCWHSVDVDSFERADNGSADDATAIVVLGTVYVVNREEFERLCGAVENLRAGPHPDLTVRLYTIQTMEQLAAEGVRDREWLQVQSLGAAEVPGALSAARLFFLGLSFEQRWRRVGQVAFPTKLAEYLAAGRPIVVNAPAESTAAMYVREQGVGVVVDEPSVEALVVGLKAVLDDRASAEALGRQGRAVARMNHDRRQMVRRFLDRLGESSLEANPAALGSESVPRR